ncbi:regulatory protein, luxR family [Anaerobranca californiensis DSM 14826]|jgi:LuxR family maltose regulon positive regulatory protein|uniref:Regulatory protein, luxR family n=1 Tax=Anaerobranca californiensis DSM 14826 TaxID=1120989 RepID=A0A1M6QFN0_9FIRM|nr:response regulator transcription factor [Anaerobranca californiensis]SHK19062.1 regulatory protein, luxR family [Anaerobranca californiensis DSM 14826]
MISRVGPLWSLKGEIEREKGNLNEAEHYIEKGLYLSKPENLYYTWNSLYKISLLYSQKKFQQGLDLITEINVTNSQFLPPIFSYFLTLWEAKICLKLQQTDKTKDILKKIGITTHSQLIDGMEEGYLILFKAYIEEKQWNIHDIDYHLNVITKKALNEGNKPLYLKTLLLLYRFHNKNKNLDKLKGILEKKRLAVDCGYYQTLIDENTDILDKTPIATTDLIEDLSKREIEILQLINKGLTNQDIADKLFLSLGTVKWYTNNIYSKLGVKNRTAALAVARKLNLL